MVRHQAVVVELRGVTGLGTGQQIEEVAEGRLLAQEKLAVVATGNHVVTTAIQQVTGWASHAALGEVDTI